ncbi:winged helix-turn-helix domain-containing protein [Aestuariimicrobium soli]|uniref:winged helix-turn-helix domain-containing protein n=1 Tax=Aestuariimicrobium soli TaxID=2035834 RepID=UPI003EC0B648
MQQLSLSQARRVALAAQGLASVKRPSVVTMRHVQAEIDRVAQFQIDTVNVVQRAQYVPLFSRLGPYDTALLDRATNRSPRRLFEYWGHAASLIDVSLAPALRDRMRAMAERYADHPARIEARHPGLVAGVLDAVRTHGPATARELERHLDHSEERNRDNWGWNWSSVKQVLEHEFSAGGVSPAGRTSQFERLYDLTERVLPPAHQRTDLSPVEQRRMLLARAGRALGVFSKACVTDYFYLKRDPVTAEAFADLEAAGEFVPVAIKGWDAKPTWLWHEATVPRRVTGRALLSPFDSMMFQRDRIEAMFDYLYRIEIYVPAPQRVHGYYVYSFLLDDRLCARVDLKANRALGRLEVKATWLEAGAEPARTTGELAEALRELADWLGLAEVAVEPRGNGADGLVRVLAATG